MVAGSRTVTFRHRFGSGTLLPQLLKSPAGRLLLSAFLCGSNSAGERLGAASLRYSHLYQKALAMVRPTLRLEDIIRRPGLLGLQQFLQRRFVISQRHAKIERMA